VSTAITFSAEIKCLCGAALNDDPQKHRGKPKTSLTDKNCVIVEGLMKEDRRVKFREIAEVTGIAKSTS
jgi:predicted DNA binding protein